MKKYIDFRVGMSKKIGAKIFPGGQQDHLERWQNFRNRTPRQIQLNKTTSDRGKYAYDEYCYLLASGIHSCHRNPLKLGKRLQKEDFRPTCKKLEILSPFDTFSW